MQIDESVDDTLDNINQKTLNNMVKPHLKLVEDSFKTSNNDAQGISISQC